MAKGKPVWFRGNKAAQKWTEQQAEDIVLDVYNYIKDNEKVCLKEEIEIYALEKHGVGDNTLWNWHTNLYKDNISIVQTWQLIDKLLHSRVVKDQDQMRPNAQNLVMRNKHNYVERVEQAVTMNFSDIAKQAEG